MWHELLRETDIPVRPGGLARVVVGLLALMFRGWWPYVAKYKAKPS